MKLFFSEFKANYSQYHFPYQVWIFKEEKDEVEKVYEDGFLPMRNLSNVYYLSRNVRVDLSKFEPSSENRRILKKTEGFEADLMPLSEFNYTPEVQRLCKDYSLERFGKGIFSTRDLQTIFKSHIYNYVFVFKDIRSQQPVGFAVCFISGNLLQYAHAFYDLKYMTENLGARMILEAVIWAQKSQKKFAYLGTCYEEKSLYKTEFKGVEFFNGFRWSNSLEELKRLINGKGFEGGGGFEGNYLLRNREYLERFYQGDLLMVLNKYGVRVNIYFRKKEKMDRKDKKKVYFIGIAGKAMAPLAKTFRDLGWEMSGSDKKEVYPPISIYLEENKISYFKGYTEGNVPPDADLVVISRPSIMFAKDNPEYLKAKMLGMPVLSYPEVLQKFLVKENSVVVAGTFGKTTISCLITWILINAGFDPSYMVGGVPLNMNDGVKITDSEYSVVEGDETPSLLETALPKFMFYKPKYLLISATQYDHPEVFKTKEEYTDAFLKLVKLLPDDGLLVFNQEIVEPRVVEAANCRKISYSSESNQADYFLKSSTVNRSKTVFNIGYSQKIFSSETELLGKHNLQNICGAVALCSELGVKKEIIDKAIKTFKGVKTRIEFLKKASGRFIYWDLAQHPSKVAGTLQAIRENYPHNRIFCVFDPSMTGLKYKESLEWYPGAFDEAERVIVGKVGFLRDLKGKERVSGKAIVEAIAKTQKNVFYEPMEEKLVDYLLKESKVGDVIVFMSSGGLRFTKLIERVKERLRGQGGKDG